MPDYLHNSNTLVVTKDELIPDFYPTWEALKKQLTRYKDKDYGIKRAQKGGGKGKEVFIDFDSLPKEIQNQIGDPRELTHILEQYYKVDSDAVSFYSQFQYGNGDYLKADTQEQYIINASVMQSATLLEESRIIERVNQGGSLRGVLNTICEDILSFNEILKANYNVQHNLPTHPRRFKQAFKSFKDENYISLVKDINKNSSQNARKVTVTVESFLNDLFTSQTHKPHPTEIAKQYAAFKKGIIEVVNNETGELYQKESVPEISEASIRSYLRKWENAMPNHSTRSGDRQKYQQKYSVYHKLKQPKFAGSLLSIDDRQPPFEYEKGKRPWFYNAIDLGSEAFVCWVHGKTKEGIILEFYQQLVRNYTKWGLNMPDGLECESSLNASYKETFLKEGSMFQNVRIEANNARGKRIEPHFKQLRYKHEKKREGWIPRPFALAESNQLNSGPRKITSYDNVINGCIQDLEDWNNMPHSNQKLFPGMSRWDVFLSHQNPNLKPTNYKSIIRQLGYTQLSSCKAGFIQLQGSERVLGDNGEIYTGDKLISLMKKVEGKDVMIYWLDDDNGNVMKSHVYINDRYICEIFPAPEYNRAVIEQDADDKKAQALISSYAMTIENFKKKQVAELNDVTIIGRIDERINTNFSAFDTNDTNKVEQETVEIFDSINDAFESQAPTKKTSWRDAFDK